jgi:hypothetical protein
MSAKIVLLAVVLAIGFGVAAAVVFAPATTWADPKQDCNGC